MGQTKRAAAGLVGAGAVALAVAAAPAIAGLPNAVIGSGKVQGVTALVNARGHTVYMYTGDRNGKSNCYGSCTSGWKPVLTGTKSIARAGSGVNQRLLGTARRRNGQLQVTYNHHPLYTNTQDNRAGLDYGQFCQGDNGYWFIVNKQGNPNKQLINVCGGY
jgi:predicted lipoprotein with Yx(FWY)xxD motif